MNNMPPVTKNLLIINLLVFLASLILPSRGIDMDGFLGLHFFMASSFHIWQPLTYMFMHATFWHLFFNMFALWMFGRIIEQVLGPRRFLTFYLVCGLGAAFMQEVVQYIEYCVSDFSEYPDALVSQYLNLWTTVGASGAIYGILLAFGMIFPDQRIFIIPIPVPIKAKYFVAGYAIIELLSAMLNKGDGVAHMAHLGGMLFAFFMLRHWRRMGVSSGPSLWERFTAWCSSLRPRRRTPEDEMERIHRKLSRHGYGSLTESEKRKLFNGGR